MTQIPAFDPTDAALRTTTPNGFGAMKSEDFMRIIFTELANQDPFQPSDSSALLDQLNSIRSIESDIQLMKRLESLVFENKLAGAANLIGKHVQGLTDGNSRVSGTVVSILRQGDEVALQLDTGWRIPINNVEVIQALSAGEPVAPQP